MKRVNNENLPAIARINVTPIIDVALTLVVVLLITAPMIAVSKLEIDLPHARTRSIQDEAHVSITLDKDGRIALDEEPVERASLGALLKGRLGASPKEEMLVVVRADEGIPYSYVHEILNEARSAGARRIAIATRQRGTVDR